MSADSPERPLTLAEAILAWSDTRLIDAVRAAEQQAGQDEVRHFDRDLLDTITVRRTLPRRGRSLYLDRRPHIAALDGAWDALLNDFKLMVERGVMLLDGVQIEPSFIPSSSRIPRHWASQLELDPRGNAIFFNGRTFSPVFVRRAPPDMLDMLRLEPLQSEQGLNLRDAIIRWCDLDLVKRVRGLERLVADVNGRQLKWPRLFEHTGRKFDFDEVEPADAMRSDTALAEAWRAVFQDLRRRIEHGELVLDGVQTFPRREVGHSAIPGAWAADLWFDLDANKLSVVQFNVTERAYGAVLVRHAVTVAPGPSQARPDDVTQQMEPIADVTAIDEQVAEQSEVGLEPRGRPAFPLEEMVEIAIELGGAAWPNHKAAARALQAAFIQRHNERRPPAIRTIMDHVSEIYTLRAKRAAP